MSLIIVLAVLAYLAWPYYTLWRLDQAFTDNDLSELARLLDLAAIRHRFHQLWEQNIEGVTEPFDNPVFRFLRGGVKEVGAAAFDNIDENWVREAILTAQHAEAAARRPLLGGFAFAGFETPTRFLVRAGALGKNPVHLYLTLQGWQWRVTAVFV
jgi:hypothetical protein